MLYAAQVLALILHESCHAIACIFAGAEVKGIEVSPILRGGVTHYLSSFAEVSQRGWTLVSATPLVVGASVGVLGMLIARCFVGTRRSPFLIFFVLASVGIPAAGLLVLGLAGRATPPEDFAVVCTHLGMSVTATRWIAGLLGFAVVVPVGVWFGRMTLAWASWYLPHERFLDRLRIGALLMLGAPAGLALTLRGLGPLLRIERPSGVPISPFVPWIQWTFLLLSLLAVALIALRPLPSGACPAAGPREPITATAILRAASLAAVGSALAVLIGWRWDPARLPDAGEIASWVERSPNDPRVLRRAASWSRAANRDLDTFRYLDRLVDLTGDARLVPGIVRAYVDRGRFEDARKVLLRPNVSGRVAYSTAAYFAEECETKGKCGEAAAFLRERAEIERAHTPSTGPAREFAEREIEQTLDRARRLEEAATRGECPDRSKSSQPRVDVGTPRSSPG
jgi:hypothetical protein